MTSTTHKTNTATNAAATAFINCSRQGFPTAIRSRQRYDSTKGAARADHPERNTEHAMRPRPDAEHGPQVTRYAPKIVAGGNVTQSRAATRSLAVHLDRRARRGSVGTVNAAIARPGLEPGAAALTVVEELAGVCRHGLGDLVPTRGTGQCRFKLHGPKLNQDIQIHSPGFAQTARTSSSVANSPCAASSSKASRSAASSGVSP